MKTRALVGLLLAGATSVGAGTAAPAAPAALAPAAPVGVRIDLLFVIDSTGSMGGLLEEGRREMKKILASIESGDPKPDLRVGMVTYRDKGDDYVAKKIPLDRDRDGFITFLDGVAPGGGGDWPEHVSLAMHVAVSDMNWDLGAEVVRLAFLIGDAPAHTDYRDGLDYRKEAALAKKMGIVFHTIAMRDDVDKTLTDQWKEIAAATGGTYRVISMPFTRPKLPAAATAAPGTLAAATAAPSSYRCPGAPVIASEFAKAVATTVKAAAARHGTVYCDEAGPHVPAPKPAAPPKS